MITHEGNNAIGRTISSFLGTHIAVGVSDVPVAPEQDSLGFETYRAEVRVRSYDPTTNRIIFAATLPDSVEMNIAEVGLISGAENSAESMLITAFDPLTEEWTGGTEVTAGVRVGGYGLSVALATATTSFAGRSALANTSIGDHLQVAYIGSGGNAEVRMGNSTDDYFSFSFPVASGYNVAVTPISSLTKVGSPDLSSVTEVSVVHSGSGSVTMDAIRVNHLPDEESLVIRQVFDNLYRKVAGMPMDIEIPMVINL